MTFARRKVLVVLAGSDMSRPQLRRWVDRCEVLVAADGAANRLPLHVRRIDHLIGDLDSASRCAKEMSEHVHTVSEQNSTDCEKALALCNSHYVQDEIMLIGLEGDLPDHALATLFAISRSALDIKIAFRRMLGVPVRAGVEVVASTRAGGRVSLLPLRSCEGCVLQGVEWPLNSAVLSANGTISISNRATGGEVRASIESGAALLYIERNDLPDSVW